MNGEAGADLSTCIAGNGWSTLINTAYVGHVEIIRLLLEAGAVREHTSVGECLDIPAGSTALSVAQLKGHHEVVRVLREAGAK